MELAIGRTIGDYQIVGMLGAGGMGKVYKVRNVISDRIEAMKVLLPDLATEPDLADRFMREIKLQASLEHPNIAGLRTALRVDNQLLMVMEFVEGVTLEERLRGGPLPVAEALNYICQVLAALSYAHERKVIHRDVKPANMMLMPSGLVKLMDFGIAKVATDRRLTMTGTTMGSLYYMSPEQIKGAQDLDARADLYSVGVSLYELVTGKRPFDGDSQFAIMSAHLEKNPVPPLAIDPKLPPALSEIILMSVAKDREQRFQTAEALRNALMSVAGGQQPAAAPVAQAAQPAPAAPLVPELVPTGRSHRGLWIAVGALAAVAAVVAVIQFGPRRGASARSQTPAVQTPAPAPAPAPPSAPPVATPQPAPVAAQPVAAPPQQPVRETPKPRIVPQRRDVVVQAPVRTTTPPPAPVRQEAPAQSAPAPAPAPVAQAPAANPANQAQLQEIREQLTMLYARAGAVQSSLNNLQRSQAASGLGMRRDWVEAANLMGSFLEGAKSALNAGDAASAKRLMEKAEANVSTLEKALGR